MGLYTDWCAWMSARPHRFATAAGRAAAPPWSDDVHRASVSLIVPTLNEGPNLEAMLPLVPEWVDEIVVIDGASTDGTEEIVRRLVPAARFVVEHARGKGAALQRGFREATGDIIVTIDGDGSMDPREIPRFVGALLAGADYVKGSRFVQGGGSDDLTFIRRLGNAGLRTLVRVTFGGRYSDLCYGYNAFWSDVAPLFEGPASGFEIETFMNVRTMAAGLAVAEVPSFETDRIHGASNLHAVRDGLRVLRTVVLERRNLRAHRRARGIGSLLRSERVIDLRAPVNLVGESSVGEPPVVLAGAKSGYGAASNGASGNGHHSGSGNGRP